MTLKKPIAQPGCSKRKMRKYKRTMEIERERLNDIKLYPYQKEMIDKLPDNKTGIFFHKTGNVGKSTDSPKIIIE